MTDISQQQDQTSSCFGYKWEQKDTYESDLVQKKPTTWLLQKYFNGDQDRLEKLFEGEGLSILDAGCGAGISALWLFGERLKSHNYIGVEISEAVDIAKQNFTEKGIPGEFYRADLNECPIPDESVDIIFSEGVLHHTDSVSQAITSLTKKLKTGGTFMFYVYVKKSPVREFTDDHIRDFIKPLSNEEAWETLIPLSKLGKALGDLDIELDIPEDIAVLGIKKGKINLQRFVYWHICKMYYDKDYDINEMNHINFDWFRPSNCIRSTPEEIKEYCESNGLKIDQMNVEEAGITVIATKA